MPNVFLDSMIPIVIGVIVVLVILIFMCNYVKVPPNVALIVSGRKHKYKVKDEQGRVVVKRFGYRIVRGGATFVIPFFERVDRLNLGIMQVDIKTNQPVPSQEYIGVIVDGVANIKIGSDDVSVATAAEQFLGWKQQEIAAVAMQVLEGNMREIIGRMTISDLVQNRDKFATETQSAATADMRNMGLEIVNITIQNFSDSDGVVETLATKNIVEKKRDAAIATANAQREANKVKAEAAALMAEQDKDKELRIAEYRAEQDRAKAEADLAYQVQQENARKSLETERAAAEMIRLQKETELQAQQVQIQREKLSIEIREKAQAERDAKIAAAEAERAVVQARAEAELFKAEKEAEARLIQAQREAEAQYVLAEKEAEGIRMKGEAEAEAMLKKAEAMKQYGQAAMMQMVIDKLPDMAKAVSEPLSKTDKIILFGEGGATSMAKDTAGTMLQTFEAVKDAVGLDIPRMLKDVTTGGLIGKAAAEDQAE